MNKIIYITLFAFAIVLSSCVKKNLKAEEDDNATYDPDVSLNKVYFSRDGDIFEVNPEGTNEINLTNSERWEDYPAVSHDANRIAYTSGDRLFHSAIDGTDEIEITNNSIFSTLDFTPTYLSWSNKSNFITFQDDKRNNKHYIDSQHDTKISKSISSTFKNDSTLSTSQLTFSPTADQVVFVSSLQGSDSSSIVLGSFYGYSDSTSTLHTGTCSLPCFFKNGSTIAFVNNYDIYTVDIDGENLKEVADFGPSITIAGMSVSPDNNTIVFSCNESGNFELYTLSLNPYELVKITNTPEDELHPFWN